MTLDQLVERLAVEADEVEGFSLSMGGEVEIRLAPTNKTELEGEDE